MILPLISAAEADVATPPVVGTNALAPWDAASSAPDPASDVRTDAVMLTVDSYPTFTHVNAKWSLRAAPNATRVLAWPVATAYAPDLLPTDRLVVRVGEVAIAPGETLGTWCVYEGRAADENGCPEDFRDPRGFRNRHTRWLTLPVPFDAQGAAVLELTYDQIVDAAWYAHDSGWVSLGLALPRTPVVQTIGGPPPDVVRVPTADVVWTMHDLPVAAFTFYPPPTTRHDDRVEWHVSDGSLVSVIGIGRDLPTPSLVSKLPEDIDEALRIEDFLARAVFQRDPVPAAEWLAVVDALQVASRSGHPAKERVAKQALADLRTRLVEQTMPSGAQERAIAWLDPGPVEGTGILARTDVGGHLEDHDFAALIDAAGMARTRGRLRVAGAVGGSVVGSFVLAMLFLRGRKPA
jgi:hypothetical protein